MLRERNGVVGVDVVPAIAFRVLKRSVGVGAIVGQVGIHFLHVGTVGGKAAPGVEIATLEARGDLVGQGLALADLDDAESAEVAVFGAEGAVDDADLADQLRAERLE